MGDQNTNKSSPTRVIIPTEKNIHNTNANLFIIPMARSKYQCPYQNTNAPFKISKFWYYERWSYERWYFDSDPLIYTPKCKRHNLNFKNTHPNT